jgi:hypothetical protein
MVLMIRGLRTASLGVALLASALAGGCGKDATAPDTSLVGTWDIIGFTDAGVTASTTGTWVFRSDGTFTVDGTVTFPGEPTDPILLAGTYTQNGLSVSLTVPGEPTTNWTLTTDGNQVTLTENVAPPANTVTLRRR